MGGGPYGPICGPLSVRTATKADLNAMTDIIWTGFPDDPGCNFKFPYRHKYEDDFRQWTRVEYEEYIEQPEKFAVHVVDAPFTGESGVSFSEPIAIGVWDTAVLTESTGGGKPSSSSTSYFATRCVRDLTRFPDRGVSVRRDANAEHMKAYGEAMQRSYRNNFARYGRRQLRLWMLVVHPCYRRHGAGTLLCRWGEREARRKGRWMLTLEASPMGKLLYVHLGYKLIGTEKVQSKGEDEEVEIFSMEKKGIVNKCAFGLPS